MPESPVQISFDFRFKEADLRFQGRGVARIEPPYRVRIDLFSHRGKPFSSGPGGSELGSPRVSRGTGTSPGPLWAALGYSGRMRNFGSSRGEVPKTVRRPFDTEEAAVRISASV